MAKGSIFMRQEWCSSRGGKTVQFIKTSVLHQGDNLEDTHDQDVITIKQSCLSSEVSIAIERRIMCKEGYFKFAGNPYAGIGLEPGEMKQVIEALTSLQV